ncbi:60s ribosomal protein l12-1 [Quercus suber]|uniref:60s ribosomal protein l12-1 n=1 Tax=Quercus suber TaxID=58331 RepID=A0AAW0LIH1_QUESU|nr:60s ribosomal protein l12-1 [Quercus suber]
MPPKLDPSQVVDEYVQVTEGEVGAASSLALKIGPLGQGVRGALHHHAGHQGAVGARARPEEDEEHQAQR